MYGKIFAKMYEGTLYGQWEALVTFQQMIVLCDADGMCDMTPQAIASRTSIPLKIIEKGIRILEAPDPHSRTPDQDGRRIERIDAHRPWGWHLVNHAKYTAMQDADHVRLQTRERVRRHREKKALDQKLAGDVTGVTLGNGPKRHTDTDTDIRKALGSSSPPDSFQVLWKAYPQRAGNNPKRKAESCWHARLTEKHTALEMIDAVGRYARFCQVTGKVGTEFVMRASTFLGPDKPFLQAWSLPVNGNGAWDRSDDATMAKGKELGVPTRPGESMTEYRSRIREKLGAPA